MYNVPPIIGQGLEKIDSYNRHRPGAHNHNIYQNQEPRHTLQPISDQGHKADHAISVEIVKLYLWIFLSVLFAQE
jgi:hypothetical protein